MRRENSNLSVIADKIVEILDGCREGICRKDLMAKVEAALYNRHIKNIDTNISRIPHYDNRITTISRGVFILSKYKNESTVNLLEDRKYINEKSFYKAFRNFLIQNLHECNKAKFGDSARIKGKWTTADIIGVQISNNIYAPTTIKHVVSAEVKTKIEIQSLLEGLAQACSYKDFSHKVYLVLPNDLNKDDFARMERLCMNENIGLILFDRFNDNNPNFTIRNRARIGTPYDDSVNEIIRNYGFDNMSNDDYDDKEDDD